MGIMRGTYKPKKENVVKLTKYLTKKTQKDDRKKI